MFGWNLAHQILPVGTILASKIPNFLPHCTRCIDEIEDHTHLFRSCKTSLLFWDLVFQSFPPPSSLCLTSFYSAPWSEWVNLNLSHNSSWGCTFLISLWHLWRLRNQCVFNRCQAHITSDFNRFKLDVLANLNAFQDKGKEVMRTIEDPSWNAPPKGVIKVNTDGCWKSRENSSRGVVFRNDTGEWLVGLALRFQTNSPAEAELLAIREALLYAKQMKMDNLILETDAEALYLMLSNVENHLTHDLGGILMEVSNLLSLSWKVEVKHIKRTGNMVAHNMAKLGLSLKEGRMSFADPPACVFTAMDNDTRALQMRTAASDE